MIETSVYHKDSNTGVYLNFDAVAPLKWKFGLIYCMLHRAYMICSNQDLFNAEINKLRSLFIGNSYPSKFFDSVLEKFNLAKAHIIIVLYFSPAFWRGLIRRISPWWGIIEPNTDLTLPYLPDNLVRERG